MKSMIIKYKQSIFKLDLISGLFWLTVGILSILYKDDSSISNFLNYLYFLLGIFHLGHFFYTRKFQYLTIENNIVKRHIFPKKSFNLKNLTRINRNSAGIKLISETSNDLFINTSVIDKASLKLLYTFLEKIESKINS